MSGPVARVAALAVAALLSAGACGDDRTPQQDTLADIEDHLEDVRSGHLDLELLASTPGGEGKVGFLLEGEFAVGEDEGDLPVADLEYTRVTGSSRRTTRFISTGKKAYVRLDGRLVELDDEQLEDLRVRDGADDAGLEGLSLTDWVENPKVAAGPRVDGVATRRVTGKVDAVPAINDLVELAAGFGADEDDDLPQKLDGDGAERVRRVTRDSSMVLVAGRRDGIVRKLDLTIDLAVQDIDAEIRRALRGLSGAEITLSLDLTDVNEPVRVQDPR